MFRRSSNVGGAAALHPFRFGFGRAAARAEERELEALLMRKLEQLAETVKLAADQAEANAAKIEHLVEQDRVHAERFKYVPVE